MSYNVAIVIPILNEAESLPELLDAIKVQTHRPREIIFVDAGSTDGSPQLIDAWWAKDGWEGSDCKVLSLPGGMPGGGRNAGIRAAESEWIAFLDGGIRPEPDWLEHLCAYATQRKLVGVFGVCVFTAEVPFERAVCALSYGYKSIHPVIPASLFHRSVFTDVAYFPEHLRAAEDLFWVRQYLEHFGQREICESAIVHYRHFPATWAAAIRKWRVNERHSVRAGVRTRQHLVYALGFPVIYGLPFVIPEIGFPLFGLYLLVRGVIDPIRRSQHRYWWHGRPSAALLAIPLAVALDLAKLAGICQEWSQKRKTSRTT